MSATLRVISVVLPFALFALPVPQMEVFACTFAVPAWSVLIVVLMDERKAGAR